MCDTYNCDYLQHITFRFNLIDFQLNTDFPFQFCIFYRKITYRYSKIGFSRKCFEKEQKHLRLFSQNYIGSNNSFTQIENNLWFLR